MTQEPAVCRLCGAASPDDLGVIPDSDFFAGRILAQPIRGGRLWACGACHSLFRHPVLTPAAYLDLYSNGVADAWSSDADRQDLAIIRTLIARKGVAVRILDVGCGSGGFLRTLPSSFEKYGVEPSVAAGARATAAGVSIAGATLADLPAASRFDVITLIDVIEHVADPAALLDAAVPHLAPGGYLIVATGDPGAAPWRRIFKARFWYSSFPEHISFPSEGFFGSWQQGQGLQPPVVARTRYRLLPTWRRALGFTMQAAYLLSPSCLNAALRTLQWLRRVPQPRRRFFSSAGLGVFEDHQVVLITRSPAS